MNNSDNKKNNNTSPKNIPEYTAQFYRHFVFAAFADNLGVDVAIDYLRKVVEDLHSFYKIPADRRVISPADLVFSLEVDDIVESYTSTRTPLNKQSFTVSPLERTLKSFFADLLYTPKSTRQLKNWSEYHHGSVVVKDKICVCSSKEDYEDASFSVRLAKNIDNDEVVSSIARVSLPNELLKRTKNSENDGSYVRADLIKRLIRSNHSLLHECGITDKMIFFYPDSLTGDIAKFQHQKRL